MEGAAISAVLQVVIEKIASPVLKECCSFVGVSHELDKLESTLSAIKSVLEDSDELQIIDRATKNWLEKLREAAYEADDIVDEFTADAQYRGNHPLMLKVCNFFSLQNPLLYRLRMRNKIRRSGERLDELAGERSKFHLKEGVVRKMIEIPERHETHSFVCRSTVYGRESDRDRIIDLLVSTDNHEDASVVSIVGMGGIGKTTLAQIIYNDEKIDSHFDLKIWVCVPEDFHIRMIIQAIMESATRNKCDQLSMDALQSCLREKLVKTRFLLVLDDVWNESVGKWHNLKSLLRGGASGSKVIVTSRSEKVALMTSTIPPYHLKALSEVDCWFLFKQHAFGAEETDENPNLVAIGKEIAGKCAGFPLAAMALGSLVCFKSMESEWMLVKECISHGLPEDEGIILPALRLSYTHLPLHQRQCFAYCSVYPKGHEIEKEQLINLWMANGFIPSKPGMQLEDTGHEIFEDLLHRSFLQDIVKDGNGNITKCKMHDLMHDLAQSITKETYIVNVGNTENAPNKVRHISLVRGAGIEFSVLRELHRFQSLRTFLLPQVYERSIRKVLHSLFSNFRCLRVLDLSHTRVENIPSSICCISHLRYLDLTYARIEFLPNSITSLSNLQTLKLKWCDQLRMLPNDLANMTNLRSLNTKGCVSLVQKMPPRIGQLKCLGTLTDFFVGREDGCGIGELNNLDLRGEVHIYKLENVMNEKEAGEANLILKGKILSLRLSWTYPGENSKETVEVLEALQPHHSLKELRISNYAGTQFPRWMHDFLSLRSIVRISLYRCTNSRHLPPLGQLPFLKFLSLTAMNSVNSIGYDFQQDGKGTGFPCLEELALCNMPNLELWLMSGECFPCLRRLRLDGCPKMTALPCLSSIEELDVGRCHEMILSSIVNLTSLSHLTIFKFYQLTLFPEELLTSCTLLRNLSINCCPKLQSLPANLEKITTLQKLDIEHCNQLVSLLECGLQALTSLNHINISSCNSLESLGEMKGLASLRHLSIKICKELRYLPGGLPHLTALEAMSVVGCPKLNVLPDGVDWLTPLRSLKIWNIQGLITLPEGLQHVRTLQQLSIGGCPSLEALPEWLGRLPSLQHLEIWGLDKVSLLPAGLRQLNMLESLSIYRCPQLERRCRKGIGEDWNLISHVPRVVIGLQRQKEQPTPGCNLYTCFGERS